MKIPLSLRAMTYLVFAFGILGTSSAIAQSFPVSAIALTPNNQWLVATDEALALYSDRSLQEKNVIPSRIEKIYSIQVSPNQKMVGISGGTPGELGLVQVFSLPTFEPLHFWVCDEDVVTDFFWKSDQRIITGNMTGMGCEIDLNSNPGVKMVSVHSKAIFTIEKLSERSIVAAGANNSLKLWGGKTERSLNNHTALVNDLAVHFGNNANAKPILVSASDDRTIRFWHPQIGRLLRFARLESKPTCVIWDPTGTSAIAGCRDGKVRIVDFATAKVTRTISGGTGWINALALASDGNILAVGGTNGIEFIDLSADVPSN